MRVKVSKELEKYRPLTTWDIVVMACRLFWPWCCFAVLALLASIGVVLFSIDVKDGNFNLLASIVGFSMIGLMMAVVLYQRSSFTAAIKEYWHRNQDKYYAVYTRNASGEMRFVQVVLTSGLDDKIKERRNSPGYHVVAPLFRNAPGKVIVGRDTMEGNPNQALFDWKVWPVNLDADDHPGQTTVRVTNDSSDTNSMTIPMSLAVDILIHGQIGTVQFNSIVGVIENIIAIKRALAGTVEKYKDELSESRSRWAETQAKLDKAFEQLVDVVQVMGNKQRIGKSADAKELRIATTALLLELLPTDDQRRSGLEGVWNQFPDRTPRKKRVATMF
jgi:hypothetical protein